MRELRSRFEAYVDRSGEHHLWTGGIDAARGTGRFKIDGRVVRAHRVAWELEHGPLPPGARVATCPEQPACVRVDHLSAGDEVGSNNPSTAAVSPKPVRSRAAKGSGSARRIRPGVWKLTVTGSNADGTSRRVYGTAYVDTEAQARVELARLTAEVDDRDGQTRAELRGLAFDDAIHRYLYDHLLDEKGRDRRTVDDYWKLHKMWFAPKVGRRFVRDVTRPMFDERFGAMRKAGRSRSRMNQARSLYVPFYRWAIHQGITTRNPLVDYELPTSGHVSRERVPPEVEEVVLLLATAFEVIPEVAEILVLDATSGMRRGELVGVRESSMRPATCELRVATAVSGTRVKTTKTRKERDVAIDPETMAMLRAVLGRRRVLALEAGVPLADDPYLFTSSLDCSTPLHPDYLTKRVAVLKSHLGIEDKRPDIAALEDEALRLYESEQQPRGSRTGPSPNGGMSFEDIGAALGRSGRWASMAVAAARRRRESRERFGKLSFDGSVLALRKFTSSELLDAGFSVAAVAQRQGHSPEVLVKHYGKRRRSADRAAAEHLGRVVRPRTVGLEERADAQQGQAELAT